MSYGLRNTLILLVVLALCVGAGWSYIYFIQEPEIEQLETQVEETRQELREKQEIANQYPILLNQHEEATEYINNFDKALYASSDEDYVFDFLNKINRGSSYTDFTFSFSDSTAEGQYGTMTVQVTGTGRYHNFMNFIRQIELNKPLNKISDVRVNPINELESYGEVNFNFTINSFYDRAKILDQPDMTITNNLRPSFHNPFYPLVRSVKANEDNQINVEQSTLLAVSSDKIFVLGQDGVMQKLSRGDKVYLGTLNAMNVDQGSATFVLNKGGIIERVTLQVNNDDNANN